jgi:hypothetical protein
VSKSLQGSAALLSLSKSSSPPVESWDVLLLLFRRDVDADCDEGKCIDRWLNASLVRLLAGGAMSYAEPTD